METHPEVGHLLDLVDAYNDLGVIWIEQRKYPQAEKMLQEAIRLAELLELDPERRIQIAASYHNLGNAQRDGGNPRVSISSYNRSIELLTAHPQPHRVQQDLALSYWDRANAFGQLKQHHRAVVDWKSSLVRIKDNNQKSHLQQFLDAELIELKLAEQIQQNSKILIEAASRVAVAAHAAGEENELVLQERYQQRCLELLEIARKAGYFQDATARQKLLNDSTFTSLPRSRWEAFLNSLKP